MDVFWQHLALAIVNGTITIGGIILAWWLGRRNGKGGK